MANKQGYVYLFLVLFHVFPFNSVDAFQFPVGGKQGWVPNPSENYNHWAERMRFQVNDTLLFKYRKGSDAVALVHKDEYAKCDSRKPLLELRDGNSVFKFNQSGPFFFISANKSHCINGQKLITVVLAVRSPPQPASPPNSPPSPASPQNSPPAGSPPHRSFAAPTCIPSLVLTVCLVGFIIIF